jgi:hypothetical protein
VTYFVFQKMLSFFSKLNKHYFKLMTATFLETTRRDLYKSSVGLGPARASPRAFFTARPAPGPGRAVKNPARAGPRAFWIFIKFSFLV